LTADTWDAFAALTAAHGGIFGGCWCLGFHAERNRIGGYDARRQAKQDKVRQGQAHAALVMQGGACIGWAQFGSPAELPMIKNRKAYDAGGGPAPDWRITCLFVDRAHRRQGVAEIAVQGALDLIAAAGGGRVEAYPEAQEGQKTAAAFLFGGTTGLFERAGFAPIRQIGLHRWVYGRAIEGNPQ
jgi:ribosomal protein S18 acetylase RimI-like enzyme